MNAVGILCDSQAKVYPKRRKNELNWTGCTYDTKQSMHSLKPTVPEHGRFSNNLAEFLILRSTVPILAGFTARFLPDLLCQHHVKI